MKRILSLICISSILLLSACKAQTNESSTAMESQTVAESSTATQSSQSTAEESATEANVEALNIVRLGGLKGPTSMGMVKLLDDSDNSKSSNNYEFSLSNSPDEILPLILKSELDIAALPSNLASVLYNKTEGQISVLAINTLGVLYICENGSESIKSIKDLAGKTIFASGQAASPEYVLSYLLSEHGLSSSDLNIEWKSEASEVVSALAANEGAIALLPQPFVTVAKTQIEGLNVSLDLTKEWQALDNGSELISGVIVARNEFLYENPDLLAEFLKDYEASTSWVNENPAEAATLIESYDILKAAVAEKAIPFCNITYIDGSEMKSKLTGYLEILYNLNPAAVGGELPDESFYFEQ